MDKSDNNYVHVPPRVVPSVQYSRDSGLDKARAADSSQARSFDNALERIRDRMVAQQQGAEKQQSMDIAADSSHGDKAHATSSSNTAETANKAGTANELYETHISSDDVSSDEISSDDAISDAEISELQQRAVNDTDAEQVSGQQLAAADLIAGKDTDASILHLSDTTVSSVDASQSIMSGDTTSDTHATMSVSGSDTAFHGVANAENIATMMLQMERAAGASEGQWSFAVLDDPTGVSVLQMQRSAQGTWRVGVSLNQASTVDENAHAEELKTALLSKGHNVDTVSVTRS